LYALNLLCWFCLKLLTLKGNSQSWHKFPVKRVEQKPMEIECAQNQIYFSLKVGFR
jgi:hypothetical protein